MTKHNLTEIDLESGIALCSVCGPTKIHVTRPRTKTAAVRCGQQAREERRYRQARRERRKTDTLPRHALSEINPEKGTAVCALCGPTAVYQRLVKGRMLYRCATSMRQFDRQGSPHLVNPSARVHILSNIDEEKRTAICAKCGPVRVEWHPSPAFTPGQPGLGPKPGRVLENTRLVTEYKRQHCCKRCGSMAILEPEKFGFFEMHLPQDQRFAVLLGSLEAEELMVEMEKREIFCRECLWLVNRGFIDHTPVPEYKPFTYPFQLPTPPGISKSS
jgi:hypothetical protein